MRKELILCDYCKKEIEVGYVYVIIIEDLMHRTIPYHYHRHCTDSKIDAFIECNPPAIGKNGSLKITLKQA